MKRIKLVILAFLLAVLTMATVHPVFAVAAPPTVRNPESLFYEANDLYSKNQFSAAIQKYEQLARDGYQSGNLYFNLGNAYFKAGHKGLAVLYYEKARRLMPRDADLTANLSYAGAQDGWDRGIHRLGYWFTIDQAFIDASIWFFILMFLVIVLMIRSSKFREESGNHLKPWVRACLLTAAVLFGISLGIGGITYYEQNQPLAVVIVHTSPVRFEPNSQGTEYYRLNEGAIIKILDNRDGWILIQRPDHKRGWVRQDEVGVI